MNIKRYEVSPPISYNTSQTFIGVDPGVTNLGLAMITPHTVYIYQIDLERKKTLMERIAETRDALLRCNLILPAHYSVIIEGASFGNNYRQVELAEIRVAIALYFQGIGGNITVVPPLTVRKKVFGNGKLKAHDVWTTLYDNYSLEPVTKANDALAALSCAYCGFESL